MVFSPKTAINLKEHMRGKSAVLIIPNNEKYVSQK